MKKFYVVMFMSIFMCVACATTQSKDVKKNLLTGAPYKDKGKGKRMLVNEKYLLMMQAALKPGQAVPQHNANSNVHIIVLDGEVVINLSGQDIIAKKGDLIPVAFKTPMNIKNRSQANATFVIIKTPNLGQMGTGKHYTKNEIRYIIWSSCSNYGSLCISESEFLNSSWLVVD